MIVTRKCAQNGRIFIVTESDSGFMIARDGALYSEAWDLEGSDRSYTETNVRIEETQDISGDELMTMIDGVL